jgi:hypothetical protein
MTVWGSVTIGRMTLRETFELTANINTGTDKRTLGLAGEESSPPLTLPALKRLQEDILGLLDRFVPVTFSDKSDHDGYYVIKDVNSVITNWQAEAAKFTWNLQAEYIGPVNAVDIESRLAYVFRSNDFALTGTRWHAPAGAATSYYTGVGSQPSATISRTTADGGSINAYTGMPASASPRWASDLSTYGRGRARVKQVAPAERVGEGLTLSPTDWELENGLLSIIPSTGVSTLRVSSFDGTSWEGTEWNVAVGSSAGPDLGTFDAATIVRNDFEAVTIRLLKSRSPGRSQLDLTLRRGSRIVEGYLRTDSSTTLAVYLETAQASTAGTGYVAATSNDAAGNRVIVGSARTHVAQTGQGGLHKTSSTALDFFIGSIVGGGSAQSGDQATDLRNQYLCFTAEQTIGVRR